jgi:uncharacterized damage-inducible protein DinB
MRIPSFAIAAILAIASLAGSPALAQQPPAGAIVSPAQALDSELTLIEHEMMGAVQAMPADKFSFAPSASIFVPAQQTQYQGVRTFAQQATHVAQANYFFYGLISGLKPSADVKAIATLTSKQDVVAALAGSFRFAHQAIATLTPANAFEVVKTPEPGLQTRATFAAFGIAHANDHYGQIVEYLRMNGIVPPASAK